MRSTSVPFAALATLLLAVQAGLAQTTDELVIDEAVDAIELSAEAAHKQTVEGMITDLTPEIESGKLSSSALERALVVRCWAFYEKDQLERALADCNRVLADDPDHGGALVLRGSVKTRLGQYAAAIADFDHAIADGGLQDQDLARAHLRRGVVHQVNGSGTQASEDVKLAVSLDPKLMDTYREISDAMLGRGKSRDAVASFDQVLGLDPTSAAAFVDRGLGRMARGQLDDAIADFDKALQIDRYAAAAFRGRGEARFYKGLHRESISDFKQALQVDAHVAPTAKALALAEFNLAEFGEAARNLNAAVQADGKDAYALLWLFLAEQRADGAAAKLADGRNKLKAHMSAVALGEWPAPVLRFFAGQRDKVALFAAAERGDVKGRPLRTCEANFFAGQHALLAGDRKNAKLLLEQAEALCPVATAASVTAKTELARLEN